MVDCYANDIIDQLIDCELLMWHHHHTNPRDILFAKQLLFALEQAGVKVFPDFNSGWHFDDKVGQKYLLEVINAPMVPTYIFYDRIKALEWIEHTSLPKVFKTRRGAGSANVRLIRTRAEALALINEAFNRGIKLYHSWSNILERWRKFRIGKSTLYGILKGFGRIIVEPDFARILGRERGYVYFQDYIPHNTYDIRVIVVDRKAFGLKRMVRVDDFRASGSGIISYHKDDIDERCVKIAFEVSRKLEAQCLAFDFIFNETGDPVILELSYGFDIDAYDACPGYWNEDLNWIKGYFDPYGWMVESAMLGKIGFEN